MRSKYGSGTCSGINCVQKHSSGRCPTPRNAFGDTNIVSTRFRRSGPNYTGGNLRLKVENRLNTDSLSGSRVWVLSNGSSKKFHQANQPLHPQIALNCQPVTSWDKNYCRMPSWFHPSPQCQHSDGKLQVAYAKVSDPSVAKING